MLSFLAGVVVGILLAVFGAEWALRKLGLRV